MTGESVRGIGWYARTGELERELSDRKKNGEGGWTVNGGCGEANCGWGTNDGLFPKGGGPEKNEAIVLRRSLGSLLMKPGPKEDDREREGCATGERPRGASSWLIKFV
jgi:hypothetical protein